MGFQTLMICNPSKLNIEKNRLHIVTNEAEAKIPVEDIDAVVVENLQSVLTSKVLSQMATEQVAIYICDDKHMPSGILMPFQSHSRQTEALQLQLTRGESFNKRCWQAIVRAKILNQANCLHFAEKDGDVLEAIAKQVRSGDTNNREAVAAAKYFKLLFGQKFKRHSEEAICWRLDYGYGIVRGAIARTIASYGFIPSIGIHHKSTLNAFNLADDFLEVFRPMVDQLVYHELLNEDEFTREQRIRLVSVLNLDVLIDEKRQRLSRAVEQMIASYKTALMGQIVENLKLPDLIPIQEHSYEGY